MHSVLLGLAKWYGTGELVFGMRGCATALHRSGVVRVYISRGAELQKSCM